MTPLLLLVLCAACYRATRLLMVDTIAEPLRAVLARWESDGLAALDKHKSPSLRSKVGAWLTEMLSCAWCTSWWLGLIAALAWWAAAGTPDPVLWLPAVALTCSAFSGVASLFVGWAEDAAE